MSKLQKFQVNYGSVQCTSARGKPGISALPKAVVASDVSVTGGTFPPRYQIQFPHEGKMYLVLHQFHTSHFSPAVYPCGKHRLPVVNLKTMELKERWDVVLKSGMIHSADPVWKWILRKIERTHGIGDTQKYLQAEHQTKELLQTAN